MAKHSDDTLDALSTFHEYTKDQIAKELMSKRDGLIMSAMTEHTISTHAHTSEPEFIPDESYKTGPWLTEIRPRDTSEGFEKVIVCKNCMTIGRYFLNDGICQFCGSNDYKRIIAQWNRTPWYKRWFTNNKGHWEAADV